MCFFAPSSVQGSSPLTRGKPTAGITWQGAPGLIPAHAGKTRSGRLGRANARAHPRSRGENSGACWTGTLIFGSSPLTRGKRVVGAEALADEGLIPAHAGKTNVFMIVVLTAWAHPRSRGENEQRTRPNKPGCGSSPLTRGKPRGQYWRPMDGRAHPRSRGENETPAALNGEREGSSPLTRGKRCLAEWARESNRLIPAHAGKTRRRFRRSYVMGAHPRSRGENAYTVSRRRATWGSSPLTRGKRWVSSVERFRLGLIPAHAGKTAQLDAGQALVRAHPRSRGENPSGRASASARVGSSPLTRGKRGQRKPRNLNERLIPAHAGKTIYLPTG